MVDVRRSDLRRGVTRVSWTPYMHLLLQIGAAVLCFIGTGERLARAEADPDVRLGHVVIHEVRGRDLTVFVDGVESGPTPWQGELEEGPHQVFGKSETLTTVVQPFTVTAGKSVSVELSALPRALPKNPPGAGNPKASRSPAESPKTDGAPHAGAYGGFEAQFLFEPGGTHSNICAGA
ncbi:MAG: PEGA domain-containing protein, partial [Polyangiaceae bacterium]|nr:PEGA domain-containing protein [Polyangiaceae bacterium]